MADIDVLVVGAGVIGLAIARRLASAGLSTIVAERESSFGTVTSSRNSEVIHAGLYYDGTPLKAELCVAGRGLLYRYAEQRHVPHRRIGKLIVAFEPREEIALERIAASARNAGVTDLKWLSAAEVRALEPALHCSSALLSPSTGIIDSHAYMLTLLADAETAGAAFVPHTRVDRLTRTPAGNWAIHIEGEPRPVLSARRVVNAAGHGARALALNTEGLGADRVPDVHYARGNYFTYQGKVPFTRLIYPVPVPGGLGTHLTLDLAGAARFGPDVEWIDEIDHSVDPGRAHQFAAAARRIWPALDPERLAPGYCGIRPKLSRAGEPAADFAIRGPADHGAPDLVTLFGIESPGLTASLAIAELVARKLDLAG